MMRVVVGRGFVSGLVRGLALVALVALAACVGSEEVSEGSRALDEGGEDETLRADAGAAARWETAEAAPYQIFEREYVPGDSSRMVARFLVLGAYRPEALSRTLMLALDSIGKADSSLVAARAILYTTRSSQPGRATLVPSVWAEWVPPGGWEQAGRRGEGTIHRTFVYHVDPGWWDPTQEEADDE